MVLTAGENEAGSAPVNGRYHRAGEALAQVAQRGSGGPIPGNIQGQVGWGSEQPGLVEDVPAHCRGAELDDL